jgi:hypothetical protein
MTELPSNAGDEAEDSSAELYAAYEEHSKTLRTWLVAYGVGAPVLLLTNDSIWKALAGSGTAPEIGTMFLIGAALQVSLAAINKAAMWVSYYGEIEPGYRTKTRYRLAHWVAQQFWIDLLIDLASMILFGMATVGVFKILTRAT